MIALGCDHGGFGLKQSVMKYLDEKGLAYKDYGTYTEDSCDYPIYGEAVARAIVNGECDRGIIICGTRQHQTSRITVIQRFSYIKFIAGKKERNIVSRNIAERRIPPCKRRPDDAELVMLNRIKNPHPGIRIVAGKQNNFRRLAFRENSVEFQKSPDKGKGYPRRQHIIFVFPLILTIGTHALVAEYGIGFIQRKERTGSYCNN